MDNEQKVVVACPKCGQKLRCDAGGIGTCPKCGEKVHFPNEKPIIDIRDESRLNDFNKKQNLDSSKNFNKYNEEDLQKSKNAKSGCLITFVLGLIIIVFLFAISSLGSDGDHCTICGRKAVYTTSSGEGLCVQHLFDGLTYLDRHS